MHGSYLGTPSRQGDAEIPSGNPLFDQWIRNFPDLRSRAAGCGHFIPEEAPDYTNQVLLEFFAGKL